MYCLEFKGCLLARQATNLLYNFYDIILLLIIIINNNSDNNNDFLIKIEKI